LQLSLQRAKAEIEKNTSEILNQQKYIATEVTVVSFGAIVCHIALYNVTDKIFGQVLGF